MQKSAKTLVAVCSIAFAIAFIAVTWVVLCKQVENMGCGKEKEVKKQESKEQVRKPTFSEELNKASKAPREVPEFLKKEGK